MTVEDLLNSVSAAELAEWQAYFAFEPFGDEWLRSSYVCAMTGNAAGGKRGGGKFKPQEFLPVKPPRRHVRMSSEQMLAAFKIIANGNNRVA